MKSRDTVQYKISDLVATGGRELCLIHTKLTPNSFLLFVQSLQTSVLVEGRLRGYSPPQVLFHQTEVSLE